ncbi:MAG: hypothetical protein RIT43_1795, partial [Bacteroidota bacterium]
NDNYLAIAYFLYGFFYCIEVKFHVLI